MLNVSGLNIPINDQVNRYRYRNTHICIRVHTHKRCTLKSTGRLNIKHKTLFRMKRPWRIDTAKEGIRQTISLYWRQREHIMERTLVSLRTKANFRERNRTEGGNGSAERAGRKKLGSWLPII